VWCEILRPWCNRHTRSDRTASIRPGSPGPECARCQRAPVTSAVSRPRKTAKGGQKARPVILTPTFPNRQEWRPWCLVSCTQDLVTAPVQPVSAAASRPKRSPLLTIRIHIAFVRSTPSCEPRARHGLDTGFSILTLTNSAYTARGPSRINITEHAARWDVMRSWRSNSPPETREAFLIHPSRCLARSQICIDTAAKCTR
jgi:hypothetical protein